MRHAEPLEDSLVWYVSYGSNMLAQRLNCYLQGGQALGSSRVNPGSRNPEPPHHDALVPLSGTVYFAGYSKSWGGGAAFYDHHEAGPSIGRAWLITAGQLLDIIDQENGHTPGGETLTRVVDVVTKPHQPVTFDHLGAYRLLIPHGNIDGLPSWTLTTPQSMRQQKLTAPSLAYADTIARGIAETGRHNAENIWNYINARPGYSPEP